MVSFTSMATLLLYNYCRFFLFFLRYFAQICFQPRASWPSKYPDSKTDLGYGWQSFSHKKKIIYKTWRTISLDYLICIVNKLQNPEYIIVIWLQLRNSIFQVLEKWAKNVLSIPHQAFFKVLILIKCLKSIYIIIVTVKNNNSYEF